MIKKTIKIAVEGAKTLPIEKLVPFQGDLKRLEREEYEKFRKNVLSNGFSFTVHVWNNDKKYYIIDGHQRVTGLLQMREVEDYEIPEIPVSLVAAPNYKAAKRKVLAGIATYGTMTKESLKAYMKENDFSLDDIASEFTFPSIDMEDLFDAKEVDDDLPAYEGETPEMKSSSGDVKQVNLFFTQEDHQEFMEKCAQLLSVFKTENITDTVLGAIREVYKVKVKK